MDKINVEEILSKHLTTFTLLKLKEAKNSPDTTIYKDLQDGIKEIVELVVDKCAEKAEVKNHYPGIGMDARKVIDKDSILKVKEEVNYE